MACRLPIKSGSYYQTETRGSLYHKSCFNCSHCLRFINGKYSKRITEDGEELLFCEEHAYLSKPIHCTQCEQILVPGENVIDVEGRIFHPNCFRSPFFKIFVFTFLNQKKKKDVAVVMNQ